MKIEVCESLACSYLRHVKRCWIIQANWKAPGDWWECQDADTIFSEMKQRFDPDDSVFKKTKDSGQLFKQGEIDVVGVDQKGNLHAMEVAFHEDGLNYKDTEKRVLKKMLRTLFILRNLSLAPDCIHIYFLSPIVRPKVQELLEITFDKLRGEYADVGWHLMTNHDFAESVVRPTLDNASAVADSSELFVRSVKLLETAQKRSSRSRSRGSGAGTPLPRTPHRQLADLHPHRLAAGSDASRSSANNAIGSAPEPSRTTSAAGTTPCADRR